MSCSPKLQGDLPHNTVAELRKLDPWETEAIVFLCTVTIASVVPEHPWWFKPCSKWHRPSTLYGPEYQCSGGYFDQSLSKMALTLHSLSSSTMLLHSWLVKLRCCFQEKHIFSWQWNWNFLLEVFAEPTDGQSSVLVPELPIPAEDVPKRHHLVRKVHFPMSCFHFILTTSFILLHLPVLCLCESRFVTLRERTQAGTRLTHFFSSSAATMWIETLAPVQTMNLMKMLELTLS